MASNSGSSFLLSAADASWGRRTKSCVEVGTVAAASLGGKYFTLSAPSENGGVAADYYVWFDLDGASVDPAAAGTGIEVDVTTGQDAVAVAAALQAAVEADANLRAALVVAGGTAVLIENEYFGVSGSAADVDTTFTLTEETSGLGGDLGRTSGGVEVTMEAQSVQITTDQTGALIQDEVFTGSSVEVTMSLLEMTPERWEALVGGVTGDVHTPAGGTKLVGYGESRLYQSFFDLGGQLILHPTRLDASDRSKDITLWKCAPKPASINFSGEEAQVMEVTFTALADRSVEDAINLMAFGDHTQDVRK